MKKGDDMTQSTRKLTMGSLFDGIGGFPLAAVRSGITPIWASEIEAFPIEVTKIRFPDMAHVGDITKLNGAELPPVDIICGGSPCQDLSVAGARAGLAGARSGLFMEQVRLVKEMRNADIQRGRTAFDVRPRFMAWENVPGAFSSGAPKGEDFRIVLEEIVRVKCDSVSVPRPDSGRWESAGAAILGKRCSVAWRVLDAQYWGVPQRRRRIFLVADFRGQRSAEILFKPRDMFPLPPPCTDYGLPAAGASRISLDKTRGKIPVIRPFQERRMRSAAKSGNQSAFLASFGRPDEPFPTLLAKAVNMISFWYEGEEKDGVLRNLTPVECERLMGLPEGWTAYGNLGQPISDNARCKALGNAIALPCADYIMAGIAETIHE